MYTHEKTQGINLLLSLLLYC